MVMGGGSCSKGHEFESWHRILDGYFSNLFVVSIEVFVGKDKNKRKRGRGWPFFVLTFLFTKLSHYLSPFFPKYYENVLTLLQLGKLS